MYHDPLLVGVPIAALTALVVEALKRSGMESRLAPWAAVTVAASLTGLVELMPVYSWVAPVARVIVAGIVLGLASSGGYSWVQQIGKGRSDG